MFVGSFFNIMDSGKLRCSASSDNALGCIMSGPGDLLVFNFINNVHIVSCVIFNSPIAIVMTLSAILAISPLCSLVLINIPLVGILCLLFLYLLTLVWSLGHLGLGTFQNTGNIPV